MSICPPVPLDGGDGLGVELVVAEPEAVAVEGRTCLESADTPIVAVEPMKHESYSQWVDLNENHF